MISAGRLSKPGEERRRQQTAQKSKKYPSFVCIAGTKITSPKYQDGLSARVGQNLDEELRHKIGHKWWGYERVGHEQWSVDVGRNAVPSQLVAAISIL